MWSICHECNGEGYKDKKENGLGREDESLILRGKIWITDNFIEPFTPPTSPH